jgi:predicted CXXCH cytochrome family protein
MTVKHLPFIILFSCLSFAAVAQATAGHLTVISPTERSFVESSSVSIIVQLDGKGIDDLKLSGNGKSENPARKQMDIFHVSFEGVHLSPGMNSLKITAYKEGKRVEEIEYPLFFRSDLSAANNTAPSHFTRYYFHTPENEKRCAPCHQLDFTKAVANPPSPGQSPCFICHKRILTNYRFVHGPAAVWSCPVCHDTRSTGRKLGVTQPDEKICAPCHENDWRTKKYMHGPTAAGNCTACHNPHAAEEPSFLRLNTADLCVSCHEDTASRPHLISSFSGNAGHPVRKSPDPFNPGRDFTCASCHNPHATNYPVLLNSDNSSMFQFCQSCHKM